MSSSRLRAAVAVVLCLALAGCTAVARASATPEDVAARALAPPPSLPAVAIAARLSTSTGAVPDLVGSSIERAERRLAQAGATGQVVAFGEGEQVTAQYPAAGSALPPDGIVILWVGEPPAPPPAADPDLGEPAVEMAPPEVEPPATAVASTLPDAAPAEPPAASTPSPVSEPAPTPRRTSPRNLPAAEPGTVLTGPASWYGPGFAGRTTACGGTFDPTEPTLATRELRCGTKVLVTGPSGASVEATVTDWGPAEWTNRRFDLSQATFAAIHHPGAGVVTVTVEVLAP